MLAPWEKSCDKPRQYIRKQRHHIADKNPYSQSYGFSSSQVWRWELCRCQAAKSIRSRERARWGWEKKLKQEKSATKMGSRGSDTSPQRDAVWHQLYSASHIYTEEREKDKTVNIFFVWPTHLTNSHKKSWEHGNGTLLLFLTPDNISLCVRSLHRTPGACSK